MNSIKSAVTRFFGVRETRLTLGLFALLTTMLLAAALYAVVNIVRLFNDYTLVSRSQ